MPRKAVPKGYAKFPDGEVRRIKYDNGLPFSDCLKNNLDSLELRTDVNKASMILLDGQMGSGKTTLAVHVADYIEGKEIDLEKQLALGGEDFTKKLKVCVEENKKVIIYDEAGDFSKKGALTAFNKQLNRIFETYRTFNIVIIMCLPFFDSLDKDIFLKGVVRFLVHNHSKRANYTKFKIYSLYRIYHMKMKLKKLAVPPQVYGIQRPNAYGYSLRLHPKREAALDTVSTDSKKAVLDAYDLSAKGYLSPLQIAKELGRSKTWVNGKIKELGIKPMHVYNKRHYFKDTILETLQNAKVLNV